MTYTISDGLRDREYAKFTNVDAGSLTAVNVVSASGTEVATSGTVNVGESVKTYTFPIGSLTASAGAGSGLFSSYTSRELNGMLKAIVVDDSNWNATGSMYLVASGLDYDVWSMQSGTVSSMVSSTSAYIPKGFMRTTENVSLSGTLAAGMNGDIPLYGKYTLIGSGMGASKSGLGVILVYQ